MLYYTPYDHQRQHSFPRKCSSVEVSRNLNYVVGLYYFDEHVGETQPSVITVPLTGSGLPNIVPFNIQAITVSSLLNYTGTSSSKAAYSQVSLVADPALRQQAGADRRYPLYLGRKIDRPERHHRRSQSQPLVSQLRERALR